MNKPLSVAPAQAVPTRTRFGVLGFVCTLSMITYLDRVCFGSAAKAIAVDLGYKSTEDIDWAFTAFALSYALFEIPTGWLGDVFGPKKTLIRIVIWWSFFTVLTGCIGILALQISVKPWERELTILGLFTFKVAFGLVILSTVRFLFGMGEAGAYPNLTRALHNWLPFSERGLGQGAMWMAGRFMGGMTPLVWMLLVGLNVVPWWGAFIIFGVVGTIWCVAFGLWFRDRPENHKQVNEAELELIRRNRADLGAGHARVPWLRLVSSVNLWLLCIMYFCAAFAWYFNITYITDFFDEQYGVQRGSLVGALCKGGPLWLGASTCLVGGILSDWFIRRTGNRRWGRRLFGVIGQALCGLCFLACPFVNSNMYLFFLAISLAAFWNDLTMGSSWSVCQDIGRRYAGIVAGCMNMIGNLGGAVAGMVTGRILKATLAAEAAQRGVAVSDLDPKINHDIFQAGHLVGYNINFFLFAAASAIAVVMWLMIDSTKPVVPDEEHGR